MSYNGESAEVAEDYRLALEDLTMNSRYEITNLTVVARENTEHALAIAEVLQDHIKKVAPQRKLPALYVLDSIVKNVGTPYTLFFGRRLYQTFMDAYASVESMTRRKMDEMLKTWKEPVPGSIDTRPVFPPDVVRPIENALIKARTTALQAQQESMRGQHQLLSRGRPAAPAGPIPYRDTPTPPDARPPSRQAGPYGHPHHQPPYHAANGAHQMYPAPPNNVPQPQYPSRSTPQPAPSASTAPAYPQSSAQDVYGAPQPGISIDQLNDDIAQLIVATKAELAQSNHDASIQTRLGALLELQRLLQHQKLPQDQLVLVKNQVSELAVNIRGPKPQQHPPPLPPSATTHTPTPPPRSQAMATAPHHHPSTSASASAISAPPVAAVAASAAPPASVSLDALFGQGALATLLASANKPATPQPHPHPHPPHPSQTPPAALLAPRRPPPAEQSTAAAPAALSSNPTALMAALRQSGLLPPPPPGPGPAPTSGHQPLNLAELISTSQAAASAAGSTRLQASSLKQFRPHLLAQLYEDLGAPCTQCGRRFRSDEEGRRKKTAHMDWHFRVHQRIAEAEKRGQHRSWYIDEMEWIKSREAVDTDYVAPQAENNRGAGSGTGSGAAAPPPQYIPVPEDAQTNTVCPICQEKFEMKWLDEAQEWVWMDAIQVGPHRVFHATCRAEAARDHRENTPSLARGTPEPVLGKRKAEGDHPSSGRGKLKIEGY